MPIHKPTRVLLHHIPMKFVRNRVAGGGRKSVDIPIALVPFIDFLIVLVVFLLMSFNATGELQTQPGLQLPRAENTEQLKIAPIVAVGAQIVTLDGRRMADTASLAATPEMTRIEPLVQDLETLKRNWSILHANEPFLGTIILQADQGVDFRVIKKVMFSAAQAGYGNISFAVSSTGGQ